MSPQCRIIILEWCRNTLDSYDKHSLHKVTSKQKQVSRNQGRMHITAVFGTAHSGRCNFDGYTKRK